MLKEQFIKILKECEKQGIEISCEEIAILCSICKNKMEDILNLYSRCNKEQKKEFLKILTNVLYINYYGLLDILRVISDIDGINLYSISYMLNKNDVTTMPKFMEYIMTYYKLTKKPYLAFSQEGQMELIKVIPEVEYESDADLLKTILLERFDEEYEHYVIDNGVLFFEDDESGVLEDEIIKFYRFKKKGKEMKTNKLVRTLVKKGFAEKDSNIIHVKFN